MQLDAARVKVTVDAEVPGATAGAPPKYTLDCEFEAKYPCEAGDAFTGTAVATAHIKDFAMPEVGLAGKWFCGLPKGQLELPIMEVWTRHIARHVVNHPSFQSLTSWHHANDIM